MTIWEYLKTSSDEDIEALGREGWELVAVVPEGLGGALSFYFKRPAPEFRERVTNDQKKRYYSSLGIALREAIEG